MHISSVVRATEFTKCMEGVQLQIHQVMDTKSREQVNKNRQIIASIAKTFHFLAKQNLPLRGHRDDCQYHDHKDINNGNFQELLKF